MMRSRLHLLPAASALLAGLACTSSAAAADRPAGYTIVGASQARANYPYLTLTTVAEKLSPDVAAQVPPGPNGRLVILNVTFRTTGNPDKMVRLKPADLQVQWTADGAAGAAPILGAHMSKDSLSMAPGSAFYTSMRPDTYELFAIVPKSVTHIDLAHRQPDGSFKLARTRIALKPPR